MLLFCKNNLFLPSIEDAYIQREKKNQNKNKSKNKKSMNQ